MQVAAEGGNFFFSFSSDETESAGSIKPHGKKETNVGERREERRRMLRRRREEKERGDGRRGEIRMDADGDRNTEYKESNVHPSSPKK